MSALTDAQRLVEVLEATEAFVDWINEYGDTPDGYRWEVGVPGKRFVRIVMHSNPHSTGGSVHAFVDLASGDLLKPAGWKAPAEGARGNLLHDQRAARKAFTWAGGYLYR